MVAPCTSSAGSACAGKNPVDVAAPWPFATALLDLHARRRARVFEDSSTGPRTFTYVLVHATLLTLTPLPTRSGPCHPVLRPGFLSWCCPKIAPPSFRPESPRSGQDPRGVSAPRSVLRMGKPFPTAIRPRGFSPPRRFTPPRPCDRISGRCRSWGSPRFTPLRTEIPAMRLLPFEAFPPPTAARSRRRISVRRGLVSLVRPFRAAPFTTNLASSSFLAGDLEALLHRRVRCSHGRCQPYAPGAPLGLSDSSCRSPARLPLAASGEEARGRPRAGLSAVRQRPLREVAPRS
jgi:hypothetical protein